MYPPPDLYMPPAMSLGRLVPVHAIHSGQDVATGTEHASKRRADEAFGSHFESRTLPPLHFARYHPYHPHPHPYPHHPGYPSAGHDVHVYDRPPAPRHAARRYVPLYTTPPASNRSVTCVVCQDTVAILSCLPAPCGHFLCHECLTRMAETALGKGNEELFPLRCCHQPLPLVELTNALPESLRPSVVAKTEEASVPTPLRLYCPNGTCSAFLGKTPDKKTNVTCPQCNTDVCSSCKRKSHAAKHCKPEKLPREVKTLISKNGWKVCPGCAVIVERKSGCSSMTCRCGAEFCYDCGKKWARCQCHRRSRVIRAVPPPVRLVPPAPLAPVQQVMPPPEIPVGFLSNEFMQSVASTLDDFDPERLFGTEDEGLNFEQFREWFDPDDLELK